MLLVKTLRNSILPRVKDGYVPRAAVKVVTMTLPKLETAMHAFMSLSAPSLFQTCPIVNIKKCSTMVGLLLKSPSCGSGTTIN
jgi:hypothetical protein